VLEEHTLPDGTSGPYGTATGPDGALWFTENSSNAIGRITPSGEVVEYALPTAKAGPVGIAARPDGAVWFVEILAHKRLLFA